MHGHQKPSSESVIEQANPQQILDAAQGGVLPTLSPVFNRCPLNLHAPEGNPSLSAQPVSVDTHATHYKGGYKYPTHPPGYGGRPSDAPVGPFTYNQTLTLAYAEPSDTDICNAALMILKSADTAKRSDEHDVTPTHRCYGATAT